MRLMTFTVALVPFFAHAGGGGGGCNDRHDFTEKLFECFGEGMRFAFEDQHWSGLYNECYDQKVVQTHVTVSYPNGRSETYATWAESAFSRGAVAGGYLKQETTFGFLGHVPSSVTLKFDVDLRASGSPGTIEATLGQDANWHKDENGNWKGWKSTPMYRVKLEHCDRR